MIVGSKSDTARLMTPGAAVTAFFTAAMILVPQPSNARPGAGPSCDQLWYARNKIYKEAGYCFKTRRAIRVFGNAGCRFDDEGRVPLSREDRATVEAILQLEHEKGCSP